MSVATTISKQHCNLLVYAYVESHNINTPNELIQMIKAFYVNYPDLIIPECTKQSLSSDTMNYLNHVILHNNATLTVSQPWDGYKGGKLLIHCKSLTLHNNATIDVSGCGYRGGEFSYQGESYCGLGAKSKHSNKGGGGAAYGTSSNGRHCWHGGGGGYGSKGYQWRTKSGHNTSFGGKIYGDKELTVLHLGSGGGGCCINIYSGHKTQNGGNGGGALLIECENTITMYKGSSIKANGDISSDSGNGSGGSIYLKCESLEMCEESSDIHAMSGSDAIHGLGRIRVDINKISTHFFQHFGPKPYVTFIDDMKSSIC